VSYGAAPVPAPLYGEAVRKPLDLPFDPIERAADIWQRRFGDSRAMAAATSIMRAQQILLAELDLQLRPHGLTFARYEALVLITFSRAGALPLRVIGQRLMVHPTSVTNIIHRLERQGLVARRPNPDDGRGTLAEITAEGRALVAVATKDLMAAEFGVGGYGETELNEIFGLLRSLRVAAGDFADTGAGANAGAGTGTNAGAGTGTCTGTDAGPETGPEPVAALADPPAGTAAL
jgi:DNA-binding MarR family transcriptional regulator